jgi:hypothetical protein
VAALFSSVVVVTGDSMLFVCLFVFDGFLLLLLFSFLSPKGFLRLP